MNVSNTRFSLSHTRLSPPLNLHISITWSLFSLLVAVVHHHSSPSLVHHHLPLSKSQIALSDMHASVTHVFGIIFLPHSVNLIHHLSPTSHHPSLPLSSIPDLFNRTAFTDWSYHPVLCLVHPLSSFSWRVCRTKLAFSYFLSHVNKNIIHSFIRLPYRTNSAYVRLWDVKLANWVTWL